MITQLPPYWFTISCNTQRQATTFDSGGGPINTWSTMLSAVPMRMNIPSGNQQAQRERINGVLVTKFYTAGCQDIIQNDRIIYGGNAYDIKAVRDFDAAGVYLTIDAVLVQPAAAVT